MIPWWGSGGTDQATTAETLELLDRLFTKVQRRLAMATVELEALRTQVEATKGVMQSAETLLAGLHQRLIDAGTDPAALSAIKDDLATETSALAAAVATNA